MLTKYSKETAEDESQAGSKQGDHSFNAVRFLFNKFLIKFSFKKPPKKYISIIYFIYFFRNKRCLLLEPPSKPKNEFILDGASKTSCLPEYVDLEDKHLAYYFYNKQVRKHLEKIGVVRKFQ